MKKLILFFLLLGALTYPSFRYSPVLVSAANNTQIQSLAQEPAIFTLSDIKCLKVQLHLTNKQVESILGKPLKTEIINIGPQAKEITYFYLFGKVVFDVGKYKANCIVIDKPGYPGPRNTRVGDTLESVIKKFPCKLPKFNEIKVDEYKFLYGSDETKQYASILRDRINKIYVDYYYLVGDDEYCLNFYIKDGKIHTISISFTNPEYQEKEWEGDGGGGNDDED